MEGALIANEMQKLILLSVIIASFAIPASIARRSGARDYWQVLARLSVFVGIYVALLLFVYPRLF